MARRTVSIARPRKSVFDMMTEIDQDRQSRRGVLGYRVERSGMGGVGYRNNREGLDTREYD